MPVCLYFFSHLHKKSEKRDILSENTPVFNANFLFIKN